MNARYDTGESPGDTWAAMMEERETSGKVVPIRRDAPTQPATGAREPGPVVSFAEGMDAVLAYHQGRKEGKILPPIPTGFAPIDLVATGMERGTLNTLGARSGHGKTTVAVNSGHRRATAGDNVHLLSAEMPTTELYRLHAALQTNLFTKRIREGTLDEAEVAKLTALKDNPLPFTMQDIIGVPFDSIADEVKRAADRGADLILLDYIQILRQDPRVVAQNIPAEMAMLAQRLEHAAQECDVAILALAQLGREASQLEIHEINDTHLQWSDGIHQATGLELLMKLHPAAPGDKDKRLLEMKVEKNRHGGGVGAVKKFWLHGATARVGPHEDQKDDDAADGEDDPADA